MGAEASPYDTAIAQVEAEIERLRVTLETLKRLRAQPDGASSPSLGSRTVSNEAEMAHDTFFGMTIADAARKYLGLVKQTKSTAEIALALEAGGLKHSSKDFQTTIRSILGPRREEFVRVNSEWGLTEWYPGMRKDKKIKAEKPTKQERPKKEKSAKAKERQHRPTHQGLRDRILEVMKTDPNKNWMSGEVAETLGAIRSSVQGTMSIMAKSGENIQKVEKGYRLRKVVVTAA